MNSLMEPGTSEDDGLGVYAIQPLGGGTLARAITQSSSSLSTLKSIKVLYGDRDWMTFHEPEARLEMQRIQQSDCGIQAEVHIVPEAGNHLYLDNPKIFARNIVES
jgi:cardiolipin-specific phospholipase